MSDSRTRKELIEHIAKLDGEIEKLDQKVAEADVRLRTAGGEKKKAEEVTRDLRIKVEKYSAEVLTCTTNDARNQRLHGRIAAAVEDLSHGAERSHLPLLGEVKALLESFELSPHPRSTNWNAITGNYEEVPTTYGGVECAQRRKT